MPWGGVTVSEQRQRFLEDYQLHYYSVIDLSERFNISRKTAYKWIDRFTEYGEQGYQELSRRPHSCPWQTDPVVVEELVELRKAHPCWGSRKLLDLMHRRHRSWELPAPSTASLILARRGLWSVALGAIGGLTLGVPRRWQCNPTTSGRLTTRASFASRTVGTAFRSPSVTCSRGTCSVATRTQRSRWSAQSSILPGFFAPTGCRTAFVRTTECRLPPTPWRDCRICRCGGSSWGSTPSSSSLERQSRTGCTSGCIAP